MATIPEDARRLVSKYEPTFRSLLTWWLEADMDATGKTSLVPADVYSGVAHVFTAFSNSLNYKCGDKDQSLAEYHEKKCVSTQEAINDLCGVAAQCS